MCVYGTENAENSLGGDVIKHIASQSVGFVSVW